MNLRILRASVLAASLTVVAAFVTTPSQAQERIGPDLSVPLSGTTSCLTSNDSYDYHNRGFIRETQYEVSVGLKIYESLFRLSGRTDTSTTMVCQADSSTYSVVNLQMAIPDSYQPDGILLTVNIYQDGNLVQSYDNVEPGQLVNSSLALEDGEDFAVQQVCLRAPNYHNCELHFTEAHFITSSNPGLGPSVSLSDAERNEPQEN